MNNNRKLEIMTKAHNLWGARQQTALLIEEMSELIKECCKYTRRDRGVMPCHKVLEEIADVEIMIEQFVDVTFPALTNSTKERFRQEINEIKNSKLRRLSERVGCELSCQEAKKAD